MADAILKVMEEIDENQ